MLMACKSPLLPHHRKKTKDSAGSSDDTASMIKGEGYVGAAPGNPPPRKQIKRNECGSEGLCAVALRPKL